MYEVGFPATPKDRPLVGDDDARVTALLLALHNEARPHHQNTGKRHQFSVTIDTAEFKSQFPVNDCEPKTLIFPQKEPESFPECFVVRLPIRRALRNQSPSLQQPAGSDHN